ncbi:condensation domain-containing protein, partial [Paenibacillus sp. P3E]|uniref:condensation domain-containing protein n=1 Tax=Paenibacillus sp. P3E TaxID=1349435 RepID=UPI000A7B8050
TNNSDSAYEDNDSYLHLLENETKYLLSERAMSDKKFWVDRYHDFRTGVFHKNNIDLSAKRKTFVIGKHHADIIRNYLASQAVSMNVFMISIMGIYLFKTTGQKDITLGIPVLNRYGKQEKKIFGMTTSTVPFTFCISPEYTILELLSEVQLEFKKVLKHQKYPYDLLVSDLNKKSKISSELFNVSVNYNPGTPSQHLGGIPVEHLEFFPGEQTLSLHVMIKEWKEEGSLLIDIDFKTKDYSDYDIERMFQMIKTSIDMIIVKQIEKINELDIIAPNEFKYLIEEFNK